MSFEYSLNVLACMNACTSWSNCTVSHFDVSFKPPLTSSTCAFHNLFTTLLKRIFEENEHKMYFTATTSIN